MGKGKRKGALRPGRTLDEPHSERACDDCMNVSFFVGIPNSQRCCISICVLSSIAGELLQMFETAVRISLTFPIGPAPFMALLGGLTTEKHFSASKSEAVPTNTWASLQSRRRSPISKTSEQSSLSANFTWWCHGLQQRERLPKTSWLSPSILALGRLPRLRAEPRSSLFVRVLQGLAI